MLALRDVHFRYRSDTDDLLNGLSHDFAPDAVTALTGASGRGKSTLLYLLGLLLTPSAGHVVLDGQEVSAWPDAQRSALRSQRLGFVFQDAALDPRRTVLDAVAEPALYAGWSRNEAHTRGRALLAELGLEHRADHRPAEISGGQAQRAAVARALITGAEVILADEPTGNLDRANATAVLTALRRSAASRTVVIATHDPFVIDHADHVLTL
ncbi:MAG: ATP-binding cassette domain-containing protein [Micrococcus sp.]|nr:ATP-binding cassette domain-containing protein [Micrococcus sp.]